MARRNLALEFHANQLETLTGRRVTGGTITRRGVSFRLVADVAPDMATLRDMFGRGVRVRATGGEVSVEAGNEPVNRVPLGQLIAGRELPRMAAALGINEAGAPMLLNLVKPLSRHLLISGDTVACQSLLHTMALSLVMLNR